ncbi:UNVERIFIED_CONTAM: Polypeptide N-acetylgalactosaminyltransferase 9 [Gekko kuhli]
MCWSQMSVTHAYNAYRFLNVQETETKHRTGNEQEEKRKGLAKPMGLVEGPGGLGQGGMAATLRDDSHESETKYEEYGYNAQLSDRISLDRSIPDYRPKK